MLSNWELRAYANQVLQIHGGRDPLYVADQIGALALSGDLESIETWKAVAQRLAGLVGLDAAQESHNLRVPDRLDADLERLGERAIEFRRIAL